MNRLIRVVVSAGAACAVLAIGGMLLGSMDMPSVWFGIAAGIAGALANDVMRDPQPRPRGPVDLSN